MGLNTWIRNNATHKATDQTLGSSYSFLFGPASSGRAVTERSAMQMTAVYSCVRILAEACRCTCTGCAQMVGKRKPPTIRSTGSCTTNPTWR